MSRQTRFSLRYWLRLATFLAVISSLAALSLFVHFFYLQLKVFTTPARVAVAQTPIEFGQAYEELTLTTRDDLKIAAWYVPGRQPHAIILVHGIHANRLAVLPEAAILAEAGYSLLLIDLRGHGQSEGHEITYGYREAYDILAAVDYLDRRPDVEQIGILGTSLGGAAVIRAAAQEPRLKAIVIESSYSSLPRAIEDSFEDQSIFPQWPFAPIFTMMAERRLGILASQINSAADLANLGPRPILIIHGTHDRLFPLHHAEEMYAAAQGPKTLWVIQGMGHANPVLGREEEFKAHVLPFFEAAFTDAPGTSKKD